ncbi:MAG: heat-inducible transcription repressor HrcA [Candidatus Omnitrophica bacterium]|nr:heat-inducible transcription repressor HrcA [Candidatus Omnitrophota bacterium]
MSELTERQKDILGIIVGSYVKTICPVGSRAIAKSYRQELSPATVRNEMHDLEEEGYIKQPHTSAGRVPTDRGYRYFVDHLIAKEKLGPHVAALVAREYREHMDNIETLIERTSKILSTLSEQAGLVVFPAFEGLVLKRIELTLLGNDRLLVVWVTENGFVQDRIIDMKEEIPGEELIRMNQFLNEELRGMLLAEVKSYVLSKLAQAGDSLRVLYRTALDIIRDGFPKVEQRRLALEGSRYILEQPEFHDWQKSRLLFKTLEARDSLMDLVQGNRDREGVQVRIGFEHHCEDIWDCSVVTTRYRVKDRTVGTLGILGPRRMEYGKVIPLVDFVGRRFGEVLEQWL